MKNLSDHNIHANLLQLCHQERETVAEIVAHLREVGRRRMYSDFKCESLHMYCVKILKYSDGEAWTRLKAAKLVEANPNLSRNLQDGTLSLTNASKMMNLFDQGEFNPEERREVVGKILGQPVRAAAQIIEEIGTRKGVKAKEKIKSRRRAVQTFTEIKIYLNQDEKENLDFLKGKLNVKDDRELLAMLLLKERERVDPAAQQTRSRSEPWRTIRPNQTKIIAKSRSISPSKIYEVYRRANSKCCNCGSVHALQIDHKTPVALGGTSRSGNLRLLCRKCNQRAAIVNLGQDTMASFLH